MTEFRNSIIKLMTIKEPKKFHKKPALEFAIPIPIYKLQGKNHI